MPFPFWANPALEASAAVKTAEPATTSNSFFIFPPYFLQSNKASCGWNSRSGGSRQNGVPLVGLVKAAWQAETADATVLTTRFGAGEFCPTSQINLAFIRNFRATGSAQDGLGRKDVGNG